MVATLARPRLSATTAEPDEPETWPTEQLRQWALDEAEAMAELSDDEG